MEAHGYVAVLDEIHDMMYGDPLPKYWRWMIRRMMEGCEKCAEANRRPTRIRKMYRQKKRTW